MCVRVEARTLRPRVRLLHALDAHITATLISTPFSRDPIFEINGADPNMVRLRVGQRQVCRNGSNIYIYFMLHLRVTVLQRWRYRHRYRQILRVAFWTFFSR